MTILHFAHLNGRWIDFDTDNGGPGTIVDADDHKTREVLDFVTGDTWSPAIEYEPVTLDHSTGTRCILALQRAAMFNTRIPTGGWLATIGDTGVPYTPDPADGLTSSPPITEP